MVKRYYPEDYEVCTPSALWSEITLKASVVGTSRRVSNVASKLASNVVDEDSGDARLESVLSGA